MNQQIKLLVQIKTVHNPTTISSNMHRNVALIFRVCFYRKTMTTIKNMKYIWHTLGKINPFIIILWYTSVTQISLSPISTSYINIYVYIDIWLTYIFSLFLLIRSNVGVDIRKLYKKIFFEMYTHGVMGLHFCISCKHNDFTNYASHIFLGTPDIFFWYPHCIRINDFTITRPLQCITNGDICFLT